MAVLSTLQCRALGSGAVCRHTGGGKSRVYPGGGDTGSGIYARHCERDLPGIDALPTKLVYEYGFLKE